MNVRIDPTFYASAKLAMQAPPETYAYTLMLSPDFSQPDALAVIDVDPKSSRYRKIVHTVTMPNKGDEFHHFGWNACSSSLSPLSGHAFLERRYLIIPGIRSSRIYVIDTKPSPTEAKIVKIIEPEEVFRKTGYSRPHTIHCGPEGIYVSTLGGAGPEGTDGPPGIFIIDCETFDVIGRWEMDRGPQDDLGAHHQMALEIRPAHDPVKEYGFLGVVVDTTNLEGSIWTWWREGETFHSEKTATIPPEPAEKDLLPPLLQGFGAVPPLVTDIDLSLDDRFLYVACWGTGELRQYDVRDPRRPALAGAVRLGGIVRQSPQILRWRPANDRDQPRRAPGLLDQLALLDLGRPILSRRRPGRDGQGRRRGQRHDDARRDLLGRLPPGLPRAPDQARGRRLLDGFVLLSIRLT